jgi:hypothetical protein
VSASQRLPLLPDVPPFSEAAGAPDYEGVSWHMLLMPSKTPRPIVERLHTEMKRIMAAPDMREKIAAVGLIPNDSPSIEEMRGYIASEHVKWGALVSSSVARARNRARGTRGIRGECCSGLGRRDGSRRSCWSRTATVSDGGTL